MQMSCYLGNERVNGRFCRLNVNERSGRGLFTCNGTSLLLSQLKWIMEFEKGSVSNSTGIQNRVSGKRIKLLGQ